MERRGDHYFGTPLFRCARLQALARGGQTLCSGDVAESVGVAVPPATHIRPRGPHRLKDLAEPIEVFELDVAGLPVDDRPLRGASATPTNLPAEYTAFVGRRREIEDIAEALRSHRIVTLLGPGGTGKTRLAVEAARSLLGDFPDGVFLAELAPVVDPAAVPDAIAGAAGVAVRPGEAADAALARALADRHVLLVVDNWEHLLSAAPVVPQIVSGAPGVHVLATSRVPLRVRGERRMPVPQLDPAGDASALFRLRVEAVGGRIGPDDMATVTEICRRLDGLPLAIELVAARAGAIPLRSILAGLERGALGVSGGADLPDRQRTVERSVAWSVDLLPADLRALFVRLGVFAGSFTPSDVAAVARTRVASREAADQERGDPPLAGVASICRRSTSTPSMAWPRSPRRTSSCLAKIRWVRHGSGCSRPSDRTRQPPSTGHPRPRRLVGGMQTG